MKIALLTIWHEKNYGAELQAYATIKLLSRLGHNVEMIDIRLNDSRKGNLNQKIYNLICGITPGHRKFANFWKKNIPVTQRYKSIEDLQHNPPVADAYIVGSDQVWNPELTKEFSLLYFLNFGDESIKRVSFASSFGTTSWNQPELKEQVQALLNRFNYVTCREKSGVELLDKEFGIKATNVVDPTLVLGDYSDLVSNIQQKNTLVYYPLFFDSELETFAKRLSHKLNLQYVNNNKKTYFIGRLEWNRVGIDEWIRNIAEAQLVITRSFHGLVFSLLFHRQFAIISTNNGRSSRITNLLESVGLMDRYFLNTKDLLNSKIWERKIDYNEVEKKISEIREFSLNELICALEL